MHKFGWSLYSGGLWGRTKHLLDTSTHPLTCTVQCRHSKIYVFIRLLCCDVFTSEWWMKICSPLSDYLIQIYWIYLDWFLPDGWMIIQLIFLWFSFRWSWEWVFVLVDVVFWQVGSKVNWKQNKFISDLHLRPHSHNPKLLKSGQISTDWNLCRVTWDTSEKQSYNFCYQRNQKTFFGGKLAFI